MMLPIILVNHLSIPLIAVYTMVGYTTADQTTFLPFEGTPDKTPWGHTTPESVTGLEPIQFTTAKQCCDYKTVGGVKYILALRKNNYSVVDKLHCMSECIYSQQSYPESRFCFRQGHLDVDYCGDDKATCVPGTVGDGYCCLPDNDGDGVPEVSDTGNCTLAITPDNCPEVPNSGQEDVDNDGLGDACDEDADGDDVFDYDNCPLTYNPNQEDSDNDWIGDACDNCKNVANKNQKDTDANGIGDACDGDMDGDEITNDDDNCPNHINPEQTDTDGDGVGDACDNCKNIMNADQADANNNMVGDACDDGIDTDHDGVPDIADNCKTIPNADQLDTDSDGKGDVCDDDDDNDTILDTNDNCVLVANKNQTDSNGDGVGDACQDDCDGDGISDIDDICRCDKSKSKTDFTGLVPHNVGQSGQGAPIWEFTDGGKQVRQKINSLATLAIGDAVFSSVRFTGTLFVDTYADDDVVGIIFNYQDNKNFYVVSSSKQGSGQGTWSLKRVNSDTGHPSNQLQTALFSFRGTKNTDVPGQTKFWQLSPSKGWEAKVPHSWTLEVDDQPTAQTIRLEIWAGTNMVVNKTIIDSDTGRLAGGRLGVYCQSQEQVVWAKMSTQCL